VPKGVVLSAANLDNFLRSMSVSPGMTPDDRLLALTPIGFDISLLELLLPLYCGGSLEVVDNATRQDASALARAIDAGDATAIQATPSTWLLLKNAGWSARRR